MKTKKITTSHFEQTLVIFERLKTNKKKIKQSTIPQKTENPGAEAQTKREAGRN